MIVSSPNLSFLHTASVHVHVYLVKNKAGTCVIRHQGHKGNILLLVFNVQDDGTTLEQY